MQDPTLQVAFGQASTSAKAIVSQLGISPAPTSGSTLITICNGDVSSAEVFDGKLMHPEIAKLLARYKDGKKCRQRARRNAVCAACRLAALLGSRRRALAAANQLRCASSGCGYPSSGGASSSL